MFAVAGYHAVVCDALISSFLYKCVVEINLRKNIISRKLNDSL